MGYREHMSMSVASLSSDESGDGDNHCLTNDVTQTCNSTARDLFISSQIVKGAIESSPWINVPNPPLAPDLSEDIVEKIMPPELFNFLAWATGMC